MPPALQRLGSGSLLSMVTMAPRAGTMWATTLLAATVAAAAAIVRPAAAQIEDDYSFVVLSDIHIGEGYPRYAPAPPAPRHRDLSGGLGARASRWGGCHPRRAFHRPASPRRYDGSDSYSNIHVREAIAKVNSLVDSENIRFAFVTGDLTDSGEPLEFDTVRRELDALNIRYFPIIGNHDIWYAAPHRPARFEGGISC